MFKTTYISVPKGLCTNIVKDNKVLKPIVLYYQLKSLYVGGIVLNINARKNDICACFGISLSKYEKLISSLLKLGYVRVNGGNLELVKKSKLTEDFKVSKYCHKVTVNAENIKNLEDVFKIIAMEENYAQQEHVLTEKIAKENMKGEGEATGSGYTKQLKFHKKKIEETKDSVFEYEKQRFIKYICNQKDFSFLKKKFKKIPFISLSRNGVSNVLGKKSKATGSRFIARLRSLGYIEKDHRLVFKITNNIKCSYEQYISLIEEGITNVRYVDGELYLYLFNNIIFNKSKVYHSPIR